MSTTSRQSRTSAPGRGGKPRSHGSHQGRPAERDGGARRNQGRSRTPRPSRLPALNGPSGFTALGVNDLLAAVLQGQGINEPYPIQQATIPDAIAGRDILGRGRTGSGKTLAFSLPLVMRLAKPGTVLAPRRSPRGLILVPTRELAAQVMETLRLLCDPIGLDTTLIIGGSSYDKQIARLSNGTDILVATPGRLYDLTERGAADLSHIGVVVIDEADQMSDLGFLPQVEVLMAQVPARGQRLLFSATLDGAVQALVDRYLRDPREHATDPGTATVDTMDHRVVVIPHAAKQDRAAEIARENRRTIVFVRTREAVETLHDHFGSKAMRSDMLHGGMSQRARMRALEGFKRGSTTVLVATDVAARGIHVDGIDVVLQLDAPSDYKDYLHRAGRTARAGARGTVITFVAPHQQRSFQRLMSAAGVKPEVEYSGGERAAGPRTPNRRRNF